jgi:hypothetical protein
MRYAACPAADEFEMIEKNQGFLPGCDNMSHTQIRMSIRCEVIIWPGCDM